MLFYTTSYVLVREVNERGSEEDQGFASGWLETSLFRGTLRATRSIARSRFRPVRSAPSLVSPAYNHGHASASAKETSSATSRATRRVKSVATLARRSQQAAKAAHQLPVSFSAAITPYNTNRAVLPSSSRPPPLTPPFSPTHPSAHSVAPSSPPSPSPPSPATSSSAPRPSSQRSLYSARRPSAAVQRAREEETAVAQRGRSSKSRGWRRRRTRSRARCCPSSCRRQRLSLCRLCERACHRTPS